MWLLQQRSTTLQPCLPLASKQVLAQSYTTKLLQEGLDAEQIFGELEHVTW